MNGATFISLTGGEAYTPSYATNASLTGGMLAEPAADSWKIAKVTGKADSAANGQAITLYLASNKTGANNLDWHWTAVDSIKFGTQ